MVRVGNIFVVAELARVKVFTVKHGHLVVDLNVMSFHEFSGQEILATNEM